MPEKPLLTVAIYFVVYVISTALSLPGATLLTLAGGAVFGLLWGLVIVSFASTLGATLAFLMARFLFRDWVQKRFGQRLATIDAGVRREGAFYLFTLRLVPVFPFFLINLLLGLTAMKARTFYWVSQLGMLAGTMVLRQCRHATGQAGVALRHPVAGAAWLLCPARHLSADCPQDCRGGS